MKLKCALFVLVFIFICFISNNVFADENVKTIKLGNDILIDNEIISTDKNSDIYLSTKMDNGGSLEDSKAENLEIGTIINIDKSGSYEFSGSKENTQISINTNNIKGDVEIILNNASITCENAPAIFVYNKELNNKDCTVKITTKENTQNEIKGARLKTSVEGFKDQLDILYYIEKDTDDDGEYYERYKYDGAISSDVDLIFEGEGILNIESLEKEGIEGKGDIIVNSGTIIINSLDDSINACTDGESDVIINGGNVVAYLKEEAEEGDGIDSNGSLTINDGIVYAFACPTGDNGLDADKGVTINGGEILAIGGMYEPFKTTNNYNFIQLNLSTPTEKGDIVVVVDENNNPVYAFESNRTFSTIAISKEFKNENYKTYLGAKVIGEKDEYGIYQKIDSVNLDDATVLENNEKVEMNGFDKMQGKIGDFNKTSNKLAIPLIITSIIVLIGILILDLKINNKSMKIVNLFIGIIIGGLLATGILLKKLPTNQMQPREFQNKEVRQMQGNPPEIPNNKLNSEFNM